MENKFKYIFLDRDGVINEERPNDYVKDISEFVFTPNAKEAIASLSQLFERIFVITNQRGIGRSKMTESALDKVHGFMLTEIKQVGGNVDAIYYCTHICNTSINRKPNIGMAFRAQEDFPEITFNQSIMVGNSLSDIQFGNKVGMYTVLVGDKYPKGNKIYDEVDAYFENLYKFVLSLTNKQNGIR